MASAEAVPITVTIPIAIAKPTVAGTLATTSTTMAMASTDGGGSGSSSSSGREDTTPSRSPRSNRERRIAEKESAIDEYLSTRGSDIEGNPLEGAKGAGRQGDRIIDGVQTEYKTLDPGATPSTIKNVVNHSIRRGGQARQIIIDARGSGLTREETLTGIRRAMGISRGKIDQLRIIGDGFDVQN